MQRLAAEADERWKSQPSYLDSPNRQQPQPAVGVKDPGGYVDQPTEDVQKQGVRTAVEASDLQEAKKGKKDQSPYEKSQPKGGPSEGWQPEEWTGGITPRR
jgi:NADH dehydrogenase [ubiquinone] 1 alpha subcomplex assembly factor 2